MVGPARRAGWADNRGHGAGAGPGRLLSAKGQSAGHSWLRDGQARARVGGGRGLAGTREGVEGSMHCGCQEGGEASRAFGSIVVQVGGGPGEGGGGGGGGGFTRMSMDGFHL